MLTQNGGYFISDPNIYGTLTHWGRMTHICVSKLTTIGSDNGLSPGRHQAIIWTNDGVLLIGPLGTNVNENLIEIHTFSLKKCIWKYRLRSGGHFVSASMCETGHGCDCRCPITWKCSSSAGMMLIIYCLYNFRNHLISTTFTRYRDIRVLVCRQR